VAAESFLRGDRIEYIGPPVFDGIIAAGDVGWVTKVEAGWVFALWPQRGVHGVPASNVRLLPPKVTRIVEEAANARMWAFLGEELPLLSAAGPRDPYLSQGCHPDIVVRVWDELGSELPLDCRAQAKGKPVLAHPETDRIFAVSHGTAYALWLTPQDFADAVRAGATTIMRWSGGSVTDLAERAGRGWIWGKWFKKEPLWVRRAASTHASTLS
jgi:hypothetical protein